MKLTRAGETRCGSHYDGGSARAAPIRLCRPPSRPLRTPAADVRLLPPASLRLRGDRSAHVRAGIAERRGALRRRHGVERRLRLTLFLAAAEKLPDISSANVFV